MTLNPTSIYGYNRILLYLVNTVSSLANITQINIETNSARLDQKQL